MELYEVKYRSIYPNIWLIHTILLYIKTSVFPLQLYKKFFDDDSFTIGGRGFPYHLEDFDAYPCLPQQSSVIKKIQMGAPWYQSDADVFNLFKVRL